MDYKPSDCPVWGGLRVKTQNPRFETRIADQSLRLFGMCSSFPLVKQLWNTFGSMAPLPQLVRWL